jgi:hypothetical protein
VIIAFAPGRIAVDFPRWKVTLAETVVHRLRAQAADLIVDLFLASHRPDGV